MSCQPGENVIGLFTRDELEAALAQQFDEGEAKAVAADVYGRPEAERARLVWTYETVLLLANVSPDCARRVRELLRQTAEEAELREREIAAMVARMVARGQKSMGLSIADVVLPGEGGPEPA